MGAVWVKLTKQAVQIFGKKAIKTSVPKKLYTEGELKEVLKKEVLAKINTFNNGSVTISGGYGGNIDLADTNTLSSGNVVSGSVGMGIGYTPGEMCPRCKSGDFSKKNIAVFNNGSSLYSTAFSLASASSTPDLYKCNSCGLELTDTEYEIVKNYLK